ncbi:MAG TPA: hypothetical protein VIG47_11935 [Gemmatimonadaceae bacterium]
MVSKRVSLKGKGADLFFGDFVSEGAELSPLSDQIPSTSDDGAVLAEPITQGPSVEKASVPSVRRASIRESKASRTRASNHASTLASESDHVDAIRKVVKRPGKEVVYVRLTPEEKGQLADVVYTYKRQGVRTSDNELGRIAINGLLADYQENGEGSLLAKVLAALEA